MQSKKQCTTLPSGLSLTWSSVAVQKMIRHGPLIYMFLFLDTYLEVLQYSALQYTHEWRRQVDCSDAVEIIQKEKNTQKSCENFKFWHPWQSRPVPKLCTVLYKAKPVQHSYTIYTQYTRKDPKYIFYKHYNKKIFIHNLNILHDGKKTQKLNRNKKYWGKNKGPNKLGKYKCLVILGRAQRY